MFLSVIGLGYTPSEFWEMTLGECRLLLEQANKVEHDNKLAGNLTGADIDDINEWFDQQ